MGVTLEKKSTLTEVTAAGVSLEKYTPGRLALLAAITEQGPGLKFVSVRAVNGPLVKEEAAEVLYGGGNTLMVGALEKGKFSRAWALIDEATVRGCGRFEVVTQHPGGSMLTVVRYVVYPQPLDPATTEPVKPVIRTAADHCFDEYGPHREGAAVFRDAEQHRHELDAVALNRVARLVSRRELV